MKRLMKTGGVSLLLGLLVAPDTGTAAVRHERVALSLAREGTASAVIAVADGADEHAKLAAKELADTLEKMVGARPEVVTVPAGGLADLEGKAKADKQGLVLLGELAMPRLAGVLGDAADTRGAFALKAERGTLLIAGPGEGVYYGVIELLEQLGCRWFMPGDLGEVIPSMPTVEVREQATVQVPSFPSRHFQMPDRDWQMRVRCGGDSFKGAHGMRAPSAKVNKETGLIEPESAAEYYALYKGKRTLRQHCVSNPKLVEYMAESIKDMRRKGRGPEIGVGPNDGAGFCECENCRALDAGDFDPFSNEVSVTDRYIWFYNKVLEKVLPEFPDTKVAFYIYHTYMRPPKREIPHPAIQGALAPIALDRVHGFSNPVAPEKSYAKWLFQEWGKIMPELYDRGYWSNLACPGFTFIIIDRLRDEIPACHALGVKGWRVETFPNYGPQFPSMYIAGKLMWNHEADVDALLEDCYEKFFGPAAEPMGAYIALMDAALRDSDHCTGSAWDMPYFYPAELRKKARTLLEDGQKKAAGKGVYEARVRMITDTFDMTEAFVEMMNTRAQGDFAAAKAALDRCDAVAQVLMDMKPVPMVSAGRHSTYVNYMKRFFRHATEQGYARVSGSNVLVAAAADEWEFQIDPLKVGDDIGLWRPEITGGNWQKIKTSSSSWSNQGLRYYKGLAWYRQALDVPASAAGKRIFLWCGGVDEKAKVWVNGQVIGISHGGAFYPFEMDATAALKPGRNVVVFCVVNQVVSEVGTGGIVAPVILYQPGAGADATLENTRDLKPTFP
jgi:hypothetical protein